MRKLLCILTLLIPLGVCACQPSYYGASIMAYSSAANPGSYDGPVHAVAGDDPAAGWASLQANHEPGAYVLADFEHNAYLADGTWDLADWWSYDQMVDYAPAATECLVIVLGWRGDGSHPELTHARADITTMAAARVGPTVVVDFRPLVQAHPEWYSASDSVHPKGAGMTAYANLIEQGVSSCG